MKTGKKIEVEILRLKIVNDALEAAQKQLKEGNDDLLFRLSYFRERVLKEDIDKYDNYFFGKSLNQIKKIEEQSVNLIVYEEKKILNVNQKKPNWIKKIYRKIVASTHPDKFQNFPVKTLKEKYLNIYRKTIDAWNKNENDQIILYAYETDIKVENLEALKILQAGNETKNRELKDIQKLLPYQWYHVPEEKRSQVLETYLKQLGYTFTAEDIKKVIKLARKRKVGTKPKNLRNLKNVK